MREPAAAEPAAEAPERRRPSAPAGPAAGQTAPRPPEGGLKRLLLVPFRVLRPFTRRLRFFLSVPVIAHTQEMEARLRAQLDDIEASLAARIRQLEHETAVQTRHLEKVVAGQADALRREAAAAGRQAADASRHAAHHLDTVASGIGGRLDEFEYKVRPLIPFDETAWAVRLADGYILAPRSAPMLTVMLADATSRGLEPGTREVIRALLDPGMSCADVGSSIGLHAIAFGRAVGPTGKVYAFEPEPMYQDLLRKTLTLNGLRWVHLSPDAVGEKAGKLTFHVSFIPGHSSLYPLPAEEVGDTRPIEVQVTTLDKVIPKGGRLDLCKIDVEGAELDVVAGMKRVIADNPELANIAEYGPSHLDRVGITPAQWFAAFEDHGLRAYAIEDPTGRCRRVKPADLKDVESVNIIFVRPGGRAAGRLPK